MASRGPFTRALNAVLRVFGEDPSHPDGGITYTAPGVQIDDLEGVFDEEHVEVDVDAEVGVSSVAPRLLVRLADFPNGEVDCEAGRFVIRGRTYKVHDVQPDGHGGASLPLHRDRAADAFA